MGKSRRHNHSKGTLHREIRNSAFLKAKEVIDQFSPLGLDCDAFVYNQNCVRLNVRDGAIADPHDDEWSAAIVQQHRTDLKIVGNIKFTFRRGRPSNFESDAITHRLRQ